MTIQANVKQVLSELPPGVTLVAAAKTRTPAEIMEAIAAGVNIIGQNYVQEAERVFQVIGPKARWHFIGQLQRNKVKKAVTLFDMIETVSSVELAAEINKRCAQIDRVMEVLVEINSGREPQKAGVWPEKAAALVREIAAYPNLKVSGLMTMGPYLPNPEEIRPYFRETRQIFREIEGLKLPGIEMKYLSMGMSDSYRVAISEGTNLVRIGTGIFGRR